MTCSHANYTILSMTYINKEDDILFLIKNLNKKLALDFNKRSEELGTTSAQARILLYIHHRNENKERVRQVDIEKTFNLSKSTVSGLIKRMEKNGIIKKEKEKSSIYLVPDERGYTILDSLAINRNRVIEKLLNGLNEEEKKVFISYIKRVLSNFNEEEDKSICGKTSN